MKKPWGDSIAKCSLCQVHAFTLRVFRRKEFGSFRSDPSWGIGSFENGEANPEHVPDHIVDVVGIIPDKFYGEMTDLDRHMNYQRGITLE